LEEGGCHWDRGGKTGVRAKVTTVVTLSFCGTGHVKTSGGSGATFAIAGNREKKLRQRTQEKEFFLSERGKGPGERM